MQRLRKPHRVLSLAVVSVSMALIFVADTLTRYEVAVAVFYAAVILAAARVFGRRGLVVLACVCVALTVLSFFLTPSGSYGVGLINSAISIAATAVTTYLVLKTESARMAAQQAQERLLHVARITNVGGLTASIAHEINQPLAAIVTSGNACRRWLEQQPPNLEKACQAVGRIVSDADRASGIVARMRSLAKGGAPQPEQFDFNQAVLEILSLSLGEMERRAIVVQTELEQGLPAAWADRVQIQQVVGNLLLNALEAIAATRIPGGTLLVSSAHAQGRIVFSIADSGVGLPPDAHDHLFDTFWTTKASGMGLGLSISRTLIEANGGQIWAERNPQGGAVFRFSLPGAQGERR